MAEYYRVRLSREDLVFSAGHFVTFQSGDCERLHGHNYRVAAEVCGPLGEDHYVVDFRVLREILGTILAELDHRMLVPTEHPRIQVSADEREILVRFEDRRWVFPRGDCLLLAVPNTTAEMLARYIGHRLLDALAGRGVRLAAARIEIEESSGQSAAWETTE